MNRSEVRKIDSEESIEVADKQGRPDRYIRRAFTLIELLVVIALIALMIALAAPAFRFMTGSRSVAGASNVVSAALLQARTDAIGVQQPHGILFFRDTATTRISMAVVRQKIIGPYVSGKTGAGVNYTRADYCLATNGSYYVCTLSYSDTTNGTVPPTGNWRVVTTAELAPAVTANGAMLIDAVDNRNQLMLPGGVDLRGVGDYTTPAGASSTQYMLPAVVMFDGNGGLIAGRYVLPTLGILGSQTQDALPAYAANEARRSQIALMLFDAEGYSGVGTNAYIDENGLPLIVNRYNGTVVRGE